jgi:electron transfer flavoprotein alpha subunit
MENLLVIVSSEANGILGKTALESVQTARSLYQSLNLSSYSIGLVGDRLSEAAWCLAGCGATRILGVTGPDFSAARYSSDAAAMETMARTVEATLIIAPATSRWSRVAAGVAHRLGGRVDTHATALAVNEGAITVSRWYYRQRMEAQLHRRQRPWIVTLEPGVQPGWAAAPGAIDIAVELINVSIPEAGRRTQVVGRQSPPADVQTIRPDADLLFVAGAGWTKKQSDGTAHAGEAQQTILGFLAATQASLGGTKSLVDLSGEGQAVLPFMTHLNQVGQTGSTPRHPKGLATCCHGEEPHVVGWRFISERRVVNTDPNCSWTRGKADVVYVADAFQVMAKVNELLAQK